MKSRKGLIAALAIIFLLAVVFMNSAYSVKVNQYAAVRQFGRVVSVENKPGLHFKVPFVQSVEKISAAIRVYDVPITDVITKDKKSMISDNYVLWKVSDPVKYIRTLNASQPRAMERIEAAVYNALKSVISGMTQDEIIEARGERLTSLMTTEANSDITEYGITIIQSEIKALDLPDNNKDAVYERMISERNKIAATYKAEGEAEAQKIRNAADKDVSVMTAEAKKKAEETVAEGEAQYMSIMKEAYGTGDKAKFYEFIRSMDALKNSMNGREKTIILDKDSELAKILYGEGM